MLLLPRASICTMSAEAIGPYLAGMNGSTPTGTINWPAANDALFVPFTLPAYFLARRMIILNGSAVAGNVDAGIYTLDGARIVSSGAIAQAGTSAIQFLDITDTLLPPGRYYLAASCSSGTARIRRCNITVIRQQMMGVLRAASAHVLPASVTFASPNSPQIPIIGMEGMGVI